MKQIAKWVTMAMTAVAVSAILPVFADGDEPEATGTVTLEDILEAARSKRYPLARLRRLTLCACLGVKAGMAEGLPPYARVLAVGERGRALLRECSGKSAIPVLTRPGAVRDLPEECLGLFTLGALAHDFYGLAYGEQGREMPGQDWRSGPVLV